jgi:glyoxylase-like metal-dependent hydrolase (beta-lactamase superfamily II)
LAKVYASDAIDEALAGFLAASAKAANEYLKSPQIPPETAEDIQGDLATIRNGETLKPDVVVKRSGKLTLAGRDFEVNLAADGPTASDVWLYDAATRVAAVGDLVTLPVPFLDTACVDGWQAALVRISATPFVTLVPGHGKPMIRPEFEQYRLAFDHFIECADSERDKASCASSWIEDVSSLLKDNGMEISRAEVMAAYYVDDVLRPGGVHKCK